MIYGSDIALQGLGLVPKITSAHEGAATACTYCGKPVLPGDLAAPPVFPKTFTDGSSLACRSNVACGACDRITDIDAMRELRCYVINKDGLWNLRKDSERVWFILTPPEPPFVAAILTSVLAIGHTVWRTPPTLSKNLIYLRVDQHILRIRRQRVLDAIPICEYLARKVAEIQMAGSTRKKVNAAPSANPHRNPFVRLARNLDDLGHGILHPLLVNSNEPDIVERVEYLKDLELGELWILASLVTAKNPEPECTPIQTKTGEKNV